MSRREFWIELGHKPSRDIVRDYKIREDHPGVNGAIIHVTELAPDEIIISREELITLVEDVIHSRDNGDFYNHIIECTEKKLFDKKEVVR